MAKTIEELYRETKEKTLSTSPKKSDNGVRYEKNSPKAERRWYEKNWGVALALIICFPIGVILLLSNPRYSNGVKLGITLMCVCLIFYVHNNFRSEEKSSTYRQETYSKQSRSSHDVGYLKAGATWTDGDNVYKNSRRVQVEIWDRKIFMADGSRLTQFYFLEGIFAGTWGYTRDSSFSR